MVIGHRDGRAVRHQTTSQYSGSGRHQARARESPRDQASDPSENRPEIRKASLSKDINKIEIDFARNQVKPQIDFVGSYSMNGLGGSPRVRTDPNCASITDPAT